MQKYRGVNQLETRVDAAITQGVTHFTFSLPRGKGDLLFGLSGEFIRYDRRRNVNLYRFELTKLKQRINYLKAEFV